VAIAVAIVVKLTCRRRPHLAYLLWMLVIVKAITPPVWSSPTGAFSWARAETVAAQTIAAREVPGHSFKRPQPELAAMEPRAAEVSANSPTVTSSAPLAPETPLPFTAGTWILLSWLVGSFAVVALVFLRWMRLLAQLRRTSRPVNESLQRQFDELRGRLDLRRPVRLVVTSDNLGPAAFGWWRGKVLLPQAVAEQSQPSELAAILAHELVHLRRFDPLIGSLQLAVQCVWWFHPAVWWANRQIRVERERACDEEVLAELRCPPPEYARLLVRILSWRQQFVPAVFWSGMRSWDVTSDRLRHVLETKAFRRRTPIWAWIVMLMLACLSLPGAARRSVAQAPKPIEAASATSKVSETEIIARLHELGLRVVGVGEGAQWHLSADFEKSFKPLEEPLPLDELPGLKFVAINDRLDLSEAELIARLKAVRKLQPETMLLVFFAPGQGAAFNLLAEIPGLRKLGIMSELPAVGRTLDIGDLTRLQQLTLVDNLTDQKLTALTPLAELEELQLYQTKPYAKLDFAFLENKPKLKRIMTGGIRPTDAAFARIGNLVALENLAIDVAAATDAGIAPLANLRNLKALTLGSSGAKSQVTPAGLRAIGKLSTLKNLILSGEFSPSAGGEAALADQIVADWPEQLKELKVLQMLDFEVGDAGMESLSKLPALNRLMLHGKVQVSDRGRRVLGTMPKLRHLALTDPGMNDAGLVLLRNLTNLESLTLAEAKLVTDAGIAALAELTKLKKLSLQSASLQGDGFAALEKLGQLESLSVGYNPIDDAGVAKIVRLKSQRELDLRQTKITDEALTLIGRDLPELTKLNISGTNVTDAGLASLKTLKQLRNVVATGTKITDAKKAGLTAAVTAGSNMWTGELEVFSLEMD
jgi:beta-lactamase regulating signal transducer with metallopeptidase domain/Leucine-rich repeat (LRR) protein